MAQIKSFSCDKVDQDGTLGLYIHIGVSSSAEGLATVTAIHTFLAGGLPAVPALATGPIGDDKAPPAAAPASTRTRATKPPAAEQPKPPLTAVQAETLARAPIEAAKAEAAQQVPAQAQATPVETRVTPPRQEAPAQAATKPAAPAPVQQAAPAVANGATVAAPPALKEAKSFREVIVWMFDNNFLTKEQILAQCQVLGADVPIIAALSIPKPGQPSLEDRIGRALKVMTPPTNAATVAGITA